MSVANIIDRLPPFSTHQGCIGGDGVNLFYTIIKGSTSTPVLTVCAAVHGCEYVGVKTTLDLAHEWNLSGKGTVLLLHAVNWTGFLSRETALVPEDKVNLNRIFQDVSQPQTFSFYIKTLIEEEVFPYTDYLIDLHSGNKEELLTPHGYYSILSSEDVKEKSYKMLRASGTPIIYSSKSRSNLYQASSIDYHIPSILLEQGENGTCFPEDVQLMKESVKSVASYLFDGEESYHRGTPLLFSKSYEIISSVTGCWTSFVIPNQTVQKGQVIGEICDIYGNIIDMIVAKQNGLVLYQKATLVVFEKELLMMIAYNDED